MTSATTSKTKPEPKKKIAICIGRIHSIGELRELADGHDEVLAEAAGITAGSWYAWPSTRPGYELVAAGLLIMAGGHNGKPLDFEALEHWTRVGYERGMRFRKGER